MCFSMPSALPGITILQYLQKANIWCFASLLDTQKIQLISARRTDIRAPLHVEDAHANAECQYLSHEAACMQGIFQAVERVGNGSAHEELTLYI